MSARRRYPNKDGDRSLVMRLMVQHGLRQTEAEGLTAADVDAVRDTVDLRTMNRARTVHLPHLLVAVLAKRLADYPEVPLRLFPGWRNMQRKPEDGGAV
jgi:integrase